MEVAPTAPGETARCGHMLGPEPPRPRCRHVRFRSSPPSCLLETAKSQTLCPLLVRPLLGELPAPRIHLALSASVPPGGLGSPEPRTQAASPACPRAAHFSTKPFSRPSPKKPNVPLLCKLISLFLLGPNYNLRQGKRGRWRPELGS